MVLLLAAGLAAATALGQRPPDRPPRSTLLSRIAAASEPAVLFMGFEEKPEAADWTASEGVTVERVKEHATEGRYSLRLNLPAFDPKAGAAATARKMFPQPLDWARYSRLKLDVFNPQAAAMELGVSLGGEPMFFALPAGAGTTLSVPLHEPWEATRLELSVPLGRLRPAEPTMLYVDNVRLDVKSLDDPLVFQVRLGPSVAGDRLLPGRPSEDVAVDVRVAVYPGQPAVREVVARLGDRRQAATFQEGLVQFRFPPPKSDATLSVELIDPNGGVLARRQHDLRVVAPGGDQVAFDEAGRCLVNGRALFPIGVFGPTVERLAALKAAGFNCVGPHVENRQPLTAEARRLGLRVLANVQSQRLTADILTQKETGCLLGYYVFDEPDLAREPPAGLAGRARAVSRIDPLHPTVGGQNAYFDDYAGAADAMLVSSYPLPKSLEPMVRRVQQARRAMARQGPVWLAPQLFGWEAYCVGDQPNRGDGRPPSYDELRSMCWLGIALGAQGIFFYADTIQDNQSRLAWPIAWQGLEATVAELAALQGAIVGDAVPIATQPAGIVAAGRRWNDDLLLIVVNTTDKAQTVTLNSVSAGQLYGVEKGESVAVRGGSFRVELAPRTTRLYASSPPEILDLRPPGRLPDVPQVRARLQALEAQQEAYYARDVALFERGARIETSWTLPENPRAAAWRRIIDGYRGTSWTVGDPGYFLSHEGVRWPAGQTQRGQRWIDVLLPRPTRLEKVVVVSANAEFELFAGLKDKPMEPLPLRRHTSREYHEREVCDVTEAILSPVRQCDRVRLSFTRDAHPPRSELLFEIEAFSPERKR